jgi:CheY-like chemotaxis protein
MLVDDHKLVRTALSRVLGDVKDFHIIAETNSGEDAIQIVKKTQPNIDIVLMDIKMPRMSGLEATKKILRYDSDIKIIMLTTVNSSLLVTQALKVGAFGYLTKNTFHLKYKYPNPIPIGRIITNGIKSSNKTDKTITVILFKTHPKDKWFLNNKYVKRNGKLYNIVKYQ